MQNSGRIASLVKWNRILFFIELILGIFSFLSGIAGVVFGFIGLIAVICLIILGILLIISGLRIRKLTVLHK